MPFTLVIEDRVAKKGSAATGAAREKIADLQQHANKVETLLTSMQVKRAHKHFWTLVSKR